MTAQRKRHDTPEDRIRNVLAAVEEIKIKLLAAVMVDAEIRVEPLGTSREWRGILIEVVPHA